MDRSVLISCVLLSGCGTCPPYPPCCTYESTMPVEIAYQRAECEGAVVDEVWGNGVWWQSFNDPQLETLMSHALALNPQISLLESKVKEAYGDVKIARSRLFPKLDLLDDFQFTQITRTGEFPNIFGQFPFEFGLWTLQLNLYYDLDIWNKNQDRVQQYLGIEFSKELDYEWGKLILCLSVAENYFKWLLRSEMVDVQTKLLNEQKRLENLIVKGIEHHIGAAQDLIAQKVNVERAQENLNELILEKEQYEHALKALVGNFCEELHTVPLSIEQWIPFSLPKCLTLDLLGRRPDIQSQIWLIESARKKVDVARKEFYPDLDLNAFFGYSTIHFNKWFNPMSTNWLIHPAIHLPIFHGGELSGNLLISKAQYLQEISQYNQMVLDATREVLDALSTLKESEGNFERISTETALIEKDVYLQALRIEHNLDSVNLLIQKEIGLYATQLRQKLIEEQILVSILNLIRATGG